MKSFKSEIYNRVQENNSEKVFIANDFFDSADYGTVRKSLNRLVKVGEIRCIVNGVYYNPKFIELIEGYDSPSADAVAHALAREYNWTIAPSGNTALNLLGLSTQVPVKWIYISDGRYMDVSFGNITIKFTHRSNKEISSVSTFTAMVIQGIKDIGKDKITDTQLEYLKGKLSDKEKRIA